MIQKLWTKCKGDVVCVLLMVAISFVYFTPAVTDGLVLNQHDHTAADGLTVEMNQYREAHDGATPRWMNSIFGGMPTYQIAPDYDSQKGLNFLGKIYRLGLPNYVFYIFISMLGFYILLRVFDFKHWMATLGAIVWAFSSYFFIIIAAGHIWKVWTLAYIPPTIAGMVLAYRGRYLWGFVVTAFFAAMQIVSNHVQMTYYFLLPCVLVALACLVKKVQEFKGSRAQGLKQWLKATGVIAGAAVVAVGLNLSNLYHTYEYSKDTMRGKSELVKQGKTEDQTDSGLERSYITAWSYGVGETWSLLIPNICGGASVPLSMNETAMEKADPQLEQGGIYGAFTQYWGEQPGTSGPVYVGALVCMLFVLALIIVPNKNPLKWALLIATILSVMLSWGKNFMPLTDWFIDHVPMYSKFRTVSSILVVAEFCIPLLAMMGLKELLCSSGSREQVAGSREQVAGKKKALLWCAGIMAGVCVVFALCPTIMGECVSSNDRAMVAQYVERGYFDQGLGQTILASLSTMRAAMLSSDAWRSFWIIVIGTIILWMMVRKVGLTPNPSPQGEGNGSAKQFTIYGILLIVLCLVDMWSVNKRYLNNDMFDQPLTAEAQVKTPAIEEILQKSGTGRNYRVLNFTVSTFNDNTTSYFFSSVGGYHAAKLRRYQELVERYISPEMNKVYEYLTHPDTLATADEMFPVINMMNTRWFILSGQGGMQIPVENPAAYGNAWFVDDVKVAANANEEMDLLGQVSPRHTAVVRAESLEVRAERLEVRGDSAAFVEQTMLESDEVRYKVKSEKGGLVVFSEIYYPGWKATIDGKEAEVFRADYVLRAMQVPAGEHEIVMTFKPESVATTETVAWSCFVVLLLGMVALGLKKFKGSR